MTATTITPEAAPVPVARTAATGRVTPARVVTAEWIKLRSLRSTWITLLCAVLMVPGLGMLVSYVSEQRWNQMAPAERAGFDPVMHSIGGVYLAQLAIGVLGVLLISGEYSTGMIRASLTAVPRRLPVLWAKLAVYVVVTFVLMLISALIAFEAGQSILGSHGTTLSAPHVFRAVLGVPLYLTAIAALAVGLGFLLRSTAGGIATLFGLILVLPLIVNFLPSSWSTAIFPYLPGNAGAAVFTVHPDPGSLGPWSGWALLCGYAAAAVTAGAVALRRRDA